MTARWVDSTALQGEPMDIGLDSASRIGFTFNIRVLKVPSETFDVEILNVLIAAGIPMTSIFIGSKAVLPTGNGPFLTILLTGGTGLRTHTVRGHFAYLHSTAQLVARGQSPKDTRAFALEALAALVAVKNQDVAA